MTDGEIVPRGEILDLTTNLTSDDRLHWDAPEGPWIILRFGYTPIGVENHPAPKEGRGLECDKLSATALDAHWDGFMQKVLDDIGPLAGKALDSAQRADELAKETLRLIRAQWGRKRPR